MTLPDGLNSESSNPPIDEVMVPPMVVDNPCKPDVKVPSVPVIAPMAASVPLAAWEVDASMAPVIAPMTPPRVSVKVVRPVSTPVVGEVPDTAPPEGAAPGKNVDR